MLHTLNGFLCAAIGFSLIDILNRKEFFHATMSAAFVALVAFCFSMTIGVLWEFFEYGMDTVFFKDMQKDKLISTVSTVELHPEGKNIPVVIKDITKTIIESKDENGNVIEGQEALEEKLQNGGVSVEFNKGANLSVAENQAKEMIDRLKPQMLKKAMNIAVNTVLSNSTPLALHIFIAFLNICVINI